MLRRRRFWMGLTALVFSTTWWLIEQPQRTKPLQSMTGTPFAPVATDQLLPSASTVSFPSAARGAESTDSTGYAELNSPTKPPINDLKIVDSLLIHYRASVPASDWDSLEYNEDITSGLTGANTAGLVFLPKNHPAIDPPGRLCDRWGTPYFFRTVSKDSIEIRSAGPDRSLFTDDDLEWLDASSSREVSRNK